MKNHAAYLCGRFDGEMLSAETDRDHIHLLVSLPPEVAPSKLVTTLKTQLSIENQRSDEHKRKYLKSEKYEKKKWRNLSVKSNSSPTDVPKVVIKSKI